MKNTARFGVGIAMIGLEVLAVIIAGLSRLEPKTLAIVGGISAFLIYNTISGLLVWSGSSSNNGKCKDGKSKRK